jgi:Xaa-Pro aminopeptidase
MFEDSVYIARRKALRDRFGTGVLLFIGNVDAPMNYPHNCYPFRQDSSFSYFFGLRQPGLAALIDIDANSEAIFGNEHDLDAEIWTGAREALGDQCRLTAEKR